MLTVAGLDPPPPFTSCNPLNRDYYSPGTSSLSPPSTSQSTHGKTIWVLQCQDVPPELESRLQSRMRNLSLPSSEMPTSQNFCNFSSPDFLQLPQIPTTQNRRNFENSFALTNEAVTEHNNLLQNLSLSSGQMPTTHHYNNSSCPDLIQLPEVPTTQRSRNSENLYSVPHVAVPELNKLLENLKLQSTQMATPQPSWNSPDVFPLTSTSQSARNSTNLLTLPHVSVPENHSVLENLEIPSPRYHSNSPDLLQLHQVPTPQCPKSSATLHPFFNVLVSEDRSNSNQPRLFEVKIPGNCSNSPKLLPSIKVLTPESHRDSTNLHPLHHTSVTEDSTHSSNRPTRYSSKVTKHQNRNRSLKLFSSTKRSAAPLNDYTQHKRICSFCKRNGERSDVYSTHTLKDENGGIKCPILFNYVCPTCQATGRNAHTKSYCPANPQASSVSKIVQRCNPTGHPVYIEP